MKPQPLKKLIRTARDFLQPVNHGSEPEALRVAHEKREYERDLRKAGHSRAKAVAMVAERYRNRV